MAFERTHFTTDRSPEFLTESELRTQIGCGRDLWPLAIAKELIDNALDACESAAGGAPEVVVTLERDALIVADNGPGLKPEIIERSLDYHVRVSDKKYYVAPTRGQLGNALKCMWAAPYVADGARGLVEVTACGLHHQIEVSLDRIAQRPKIQHDIEESSVKIGTSVKIHWRGIAGSKPFDYSADFYQPGRLLETFADALADLVADFSAFNPHVTFRIGELSFPASSPAWSKWRTDAPTSPHWYRPEDLRALIAAYLSNENGGLPRTARDFIAEFAGLSGTQYRKRVLEDAGIAGGTLRDLVVNGEVPLAPVARLLEAMRKHSRAIKPAALGVIGEEHLRNSLLKLDVAEDSFRYKKVAGVDDSGLPFVIEAAFAVKNDSDEARRLMMGINWSPIFKVSSDRIGDLLTESRADRHDPIVLLIHQACPRFDFVDHGKAAIAESSAARNLALANALRDVTPEWRKAKRSENKDHRLSPAQIERLKKEVERDKIKAAAYAAMPHAYALASSNGTLPANARQVMYAARPLVLAATGGKCWSNSAYFTQALLPDYLREHPKETETWDVVFDDRGHFTEPHTSERIGLGTLAVRQYIRSWNNAGASAELALTISDLYPTAGPQNRYRFALFIEKEGFMPLLERAHIAERFDLAIMSTKGMSVTAARKLVEELASRNVTILVVHDFDMSGLGILHTLGHDTRRYEFAVEPELIDLGLRLADVEAMKLQSEPVIYRQRKDPAERLLEYGATADESAFLVEGHRYDGWTGQRVELNAMTSDRFVTWIEQKLTDNGVEKMVPKANILEAQWRRACWFARVKAAINDLKQSTNDAPAPENLDQQVRELLVQYPHMAWDEAMSLMVIAKTEEEQ